jgi:YidC/Oxa1 family membrane protein insertase
MLKSFWINFLYNPLVNLLAFFVSVVPGGDVGVAVIILTLLVKFALFPLSKISIKNQAVMNIITPELNKIRESKASREEQARKTLELYKKHQINPFSSFLLILIQIPILIALYFVFLNGTAFEKNVIYSFISVPEKVNTLFLGLIEIKGKSLFLAALVCVSQYAQACFMPKPKVSSTNSGSFQESFAQSMHIQMKYVFPLLMALAAYYTSGAIALYFIVSNLFAIGQQIYLDKQKELSNI